MERICISFNIKQGSKEEYIRRHNEIWPELVDLMSQYGFSNQTIFINDINVGFQNISVNSSSSQIVHFSIM